MTREQIIAEVQAFVVMYGDQAYFKALEAMYVSVRLGDESGANRLALTAQELMLMGYHKHERQENVAAVLASDDDPEVAADGG